ncbi:hypothetical protein CIPAW_13G178800 [Carya illinoinensis]|uniref:Uncharacterized protein n=1 Tax=Carya illinoinensis TaxID=32201 RepID=A0A8T1NSS7_CARIL|nr:hypothetical protein CIPAW_13G178800 [Carya illinoinensis]
MKFERGCAVEGPRGDSWYVGPRSRCGCIPSLPISFHPHLGGQPLTFIHRDPDFKKHKKRKEKMKTQPLTECMAGRRGMGWVGDLKTNQTPFIHQSTPNQLIETSFYAPFIEEKNEKP